MSRKNLTGVPLLDKFLVKEVFSVMRKKGVDYTEGSSDRLFQFRQAAKKYGLTMKQVWGVFFEKQASAVAAYIKNGTESEPIDSRITDVIVYSLLLKLILDEDRAKKPKRRRKK